MSYDESAIEALEGLEAVRKRLGPVNIDTEEGRLWALQVVLAYGWERDEVIELDEWTPGSIREAFDDIQWHSVRDDCVVFPAQGFENPCWHPLDDEMKSRLIRHGSTVWVERVQ